MYASIGAGLSRTLTGERLRQARVRMIREDMLNTRPTLCWRCGGVVDTTLSGLHPEGLTVGHILPISKGGDDRYGNLGREHRRCNLAAGNRIVPPKAAIASPFFVGE